MSTDEYVPDEEDVRNAYALEGARDTIGDLCHRDIPVARAEFDRFLARVKRDAAREALDGLADSWEARGRVAGAHSARIYRDTHHTGTED